MSERRPAVQLCTCNASFALDVEALAHGLGSGASLSLHRQLCRSEAGALEAACRAGEVRVGCTQESALFAEIAEDCGAAQRLATFNLRESAGWSSEGAAAAPKMAALVAAALLPAAEAVTGVTLRSAGRLAIVGEAGAALGWAERLQDQLTVTVLIAGRSHEAELPLERRYPVDSGRSVRLSGHLGAFTLEWSQDNPIDLERCVRCNACVKACPEQAIGFDYQVDATRCGAHRDCVAACGAIGAIDFARGPLARSEEFDLVLDLCADPLLKRVAAPQGYRAAGRDVLEQALAVQDLLALQGEFDKPRYVAYEPAICAHSRSKLAGCSQCIEVCASEAITAAGDRIAVDPYLCQGCGTCSTVCPTGALSFQYPRVPDLGVRLKTLLKVYREAGGDDACILFHSAGSGREALLRLARHGRGLPARVIPVESWSADAVGADLLASSLALGAVQVAVLAAGSHDAAPLIRQAAMLEAIVGELGYAGEHFRVIDADDVAALEAALWEWPPAAGVASPATFRPFAEKRTTLEFALDHLIAHAPRQPLPAAIALPAGAPYGALAVSEACTLCMSCVGLCPTGALQCPTDTPRLDFIERNCVQCGLCATGCPERAIRLEPRLLLEGRKRRRSLREAEIFHCVSCGKPMGTKPMIEAMLSRLSGHSMFAGEAALRRLGMCADCRVVDLVANEQSIKAWDLKE